MSENSPALSPSDLLGWRCFDHIADVGVIGFGPTPRFAFQEAARAMAAIITETPIDLSDYALITCAADNVEDLFVAWLNALIYEMAAREMIFGEFAVRIAGARLCAAAYGEPIDRAKHQPASELKGATYTELRVSRGENGLWSAQCVIDV